MKDPNKPDYKELNKKEHFWSGVYSVVVSASFCLISGLFKLIPSILLNRRLFFDYPLKKFRGKIFERIEGDQFFDNTSRRIFGENGGYKELVAVIILKIILLYFILK